jgi:hypothetical protein
MLVEHIRRVLEDLHKHAISVDEALERLRALPYEELGFAKLDHHRVLRRGFQRSSSVKVRRLSKLSKS